MLTLIAESKTMAPEIEIPADLYTHHTPAGESEADSIMKTFASMSAPELAELTGLPSSLAAKMRGYAYEFPNKSSGNKAIEAFTGVVFNALAHSSLSPAAQKRCNDNVGIVSSLYGFLMPEDIIKNYRLDYASHILLPSGRETTACTFQKKYVTINVIKTLKERKITEILNLLPGDAAKCVDWKIVKNFAKVWKVDFTDASTDKTPAAGRLKTMRGMLLRQILEEGITSAEELKSIVSDSYLCTGTPRYPDHLHFFC